MCGPIRGVDERRQSEFVRRSFIDFYWPPATAAALSRGDSLALVVVVRVMFVTATLAAASYGHVGRAWAAACIALVAYGVLELLVSLVLSRRRMLGRP
jgi:uncharacterized membrane protein YtjA (UPF0391 family)